MKEDNIYKAISKAQGMIGSVTKNAKNPFFKSNYADLNEILEQVLPVLQSSGIVLTQCPQITGGQIDVLHSRLTLIDKPESFIESSTRLYLPSADMQKYGSAISYARRYSILSMLNLRTEDDDGNSATKTPTPTQKKNMAINKAMDKLDEAKKNADIETATQIYEWAEDNDYVQVIDKHIKLFGE